MRVSVCLCVRVHRCVRMLVYVHKCVSTGSQLLGIQLKGY